jgi:hypothetical protein
VQGRKSVIDLHHGLGHAVVVRVFGLERELEKTARNCRTYASPIASKTAIGAYLPQSLVTIGNQLQAEFRIQRRWRRAKDSTDKVVVEVRRTQSDLGLLQFEQTVVMPGSLTEHSERERVAAQKIPISIRRLPGGLDQLGSKQSGQRQPWAKGDDPTEDFSTVVAGHAHRGYLAGLFVHVKVRGPAHFGTSVAEVYGPFGVMGKAR